MDDVVIFRMDIGYRILYRVYIVEPTEIRRYDRTSAACQQFAHRSASKWPCGSRSTRAQPSRDTAGSKAEQVIVAGSARTPWVRLQRSKKSVGRIIIRAAGPHRVARRIRWWTRSANEARRWQAPSLTAILTAAAGRRKWRKS